MEAEKPIPAYQEIYQRIRDELQGFGLRFGKR
jgi:hypothetical protein